MSVPSESLHEKLGRQRDPEPPEQAFGPAPPLLLYVALMLFAFVLLLIARRSDSWDLPSFYVNLASDIIGAVVILLVVEHRLRKKELSVIRHVPRTAGLYAAMALSSEIRQIIGFARILSARMEAVAKPYYVSRPRLEAEVAAKIEHGLVLVGGPGTGKSTILHRIVRSQAVEVMQKPRKARIPVLVSSRMWNEGDAADILFKTMRSYFPISPKTFRDLLRRGRLLCVFDSVDESLRPAERMEAIRDLWRQCPGNAVVLSSRPLSDGSLGSLGLQQLEIPPLAPDEVARLLELRNRMAEHSWYEEGGRGDA